MGGFTPGIFDAFRAGSGDFPDYIIRERARRAGALPVCTFDRRLQSEEGFAGPSQWRRGFDAGEVRERAGIYGRRKARARSPRRRR